MGDIILERNPAQVMKLDENEQALLNEIEIADEPRKFQYKPKGRKKTGFTTTGGRSRHGRGY